MNGKHGQLPECTYSLFQYTMSLVQTFSTEAARKKYFKKFYFRKWKVNSHHKRLHWLPVSSILVSLNTDVCFASRRSQLTGIFKKEKKRKHGAKSNLQNKLNEQKLRKCSSATLNPADLCRRAIALLILGSYAEDDSWPVRGGAVDVGVVQVRGAHWAGRFGAAVDPDESHLTWTLRASGAALLHRHVHGILKDTARWRGGSFPSDVDRIICLCKKKQKKRERAIWRKALQSENNVLMFSRQLIISSCSFDYPWLITLVILTAEGAPGNPGWQVLNSLTGLKSPLPKQLIPATLNL